ILPATQFGIDRLGLAQEFVENRRREGQENPLIRKILFGQPCQCRRAIAAWAEADLALLAVAEEELAVARLKTLVERAFAASAFLEGAQDEFDVLAGAKGIGDEVAAGAGIVAAAIAANDDGVRAVALRVANQELGEDWLFAEVSHLKVLGAAKLLAQ